MHTSLRFIHCADIHLDAPFQGMRLRNEIAQDLLRNSTFRAFEKVIQTAVQQHVDFVLIAGDIYNTSDKSLRAQLFFLRQMKILFDNNIPCFLVHGNHDPLDGWEMKNTFPENVHRFSSQIEVKTLYDAENKPFVNVVGYSYPKRAVQKNIALSLIQEATKIPNEAFTIGLLHGNIGGDPSTENYAPCTRNDLLHPSIHYWAMGHVHKNQILQDSSPSIVYPGNTQGLHVNDTQKKGFYLVTTGDGETLFDFIETAQFAWFSEKITVVEESLPDLLENLLQTMVDSSQNCPGIFRIQLEGRTSLHKELKYAGTDFEKSLQERMEGENCFLESIRVQTKPMLDFDAIKKREDFSSLFLQSIDSIPVDPSVRKEKILDLLENMSIQKLLGMLPDRGQSLDWEAIVNEAQTKGIDYLLETENEN